MATGTEDGGGKAWERGLPLGIRVEIEAGDAAMLDKDSFAMSSEFRVKMTLPEAVYKHPALRGEVAEVVAGAVKQFLMARVR